MKNPFSPRFLLALLTLALLTSPFHAEANRFKQYTEKYASPTHPATPIASSYLGGDGDEYLIGGAFRSDGTLYLVGNAFGPEFNLSSAKVSVLGQDEPAPDFSMPMKKGRPRPPDSWKHQDGAGFIVRLSPDYQSITRAIRFPWGSGVLSDIVTGDDGHLYIAGTVGDTFASLTSSKKADAGEDLSGDDEIFIARLKPDLSGFDWVYRVQDDAGTPPQLQSIGDGLISMVGANGFHFNQQGRIVNAKPLGLTNSWQRGVSFQNFSQTTGNFHRSNTGWEPWHRPFAIIRNPDKSMRFRFYQWDSRSVGTNYSRDVSDSKLNMAAYDRNGQPVIAGWSDGGNSVWADVPYDFKKSVRAAIEENTGRKSGLPFSTWGAGVGSFLHLNRLDYETGNPLSYTLFISYLASKNAPSSVGGDNMHFTVDNELLLSGNSAYGLIQTRDLTVNTLNYDGDYIGREFFALLTENWDDIRFSSAVPGAGQVAIHRHSAKRKGHFRFDSAHVNGKTRAVAVTGAVQNDQFKQIQPVQNGFGGGNLDGLFVVLEMESLDRLPEPEFKYPSSGSRSIDLPESDTDLEGTFMVSREMRTSDSILFLRDTTAKKWPVYYRGNPVGKNLVKAGGAGSFVLQGPSDRVQLGEDGVQGKSRRLGGGDGTTEGYPELKLEITLTSRNTAKGTISYQGKRLERKGPVSIRPSSPVGKGIALSGFFRATKAELDLSESPQDAHDEILIGWWAPGRPAPKEMREGAGTSSNPSSSNTDSARSAPETTSEVSPEPRTWAHRSGNRVKARLGDITPAGVVLETETNQKATVALETLSQKDRDYIFEETGFRVWTSQDGRTLVARLSDVRKDAAEVVTPEEQTYTIPLNRLTGKDRQFVSRNK